MFRLSVEGEDMQTINVKVCPYVNEDDRCCKFPSGGLGDADIDNNACTKCEFYPERCHRITLKLAKINYPED